MFCPLHHLPPHNGHSFSFAAAETSYSKACTAEQMLLTALYGASPDAMRQQDREQQQQHARTLGLCVLCQAAGHSILHLSLAAAACLNSRPAQLVKAQVRGP